MPSENPNGQSQDEPDLNGVIVVLLTERIPRGRSGNLTDLARELGLDDLARRLDELGAPPARPLVTGVGVDRLLRAEAIASRTGFPPLRSLTRYWRIDLRGDDRGISPGRIAELVDRLRSFREEIEFVYAELTVTQPSAGVTAVANPNRAHQGYLRPAPEGIDAEWAWTRAGGRGEAGGLVDVEVGWLTDHPDLVGHGTIPLICNINAAPSIDAGDHGNGTLGVVAAVDNEIGVIGIAPDIDSLRLASHYKEVPNPAGDHLPPVRRTMFVADAVATAAVAMHPGQVLLLEVQRKGLPAEVHLADFDAIRLAAARNVTAVEAAGNGNHDLDGVSPFSGDPGIDFWFHPGRPDSGAVLVGSCRSVQLDGGHERSGSSNYGSRVDCSAWGDSVSTLNHDDYVVDFGGTSSASAIVAGAAVLAQSTYTTATGCSVLTPTLLRHLLSDPRNGTPQTGPDAGMKRIGPMPDLRRIAAALGTWPR